MANRRGRGRVVLIEEYAEYAADDEFWRPGRGRRRRAWPRWRRALTRRAVLLIALAALLVVTLTGTALFVTGALNPFARMGTLAELPALPPGAAYDAVATDGAGWVWVAQSAPGTARQPHDATLLTVVAPGTLIGDPVQARLCFGCPGMASATASLVPALTRVDALAADPGVPHTVYVAGWAAGTAGAAPTPVIVHVNLLPGARSCSAASRCGVASVILAPATPILTADATPFQPLLAAALKGGALPTMTLATAPDGDLFAALSDRGATTLSVASTNVAGGVQLILKYAVRQRQWSLVGNFPAGFPAAQRLGALSTVTALAVDRAERYLYLADADHHAIFRLDLGSAALRTATPLALTAPVFMEAALSRYAGAALQATPPGADAEQAVPGWQGDGGPALNARLGVVRGLAFDAAGDLVLADATNGRLRLITPHGTIWTVAGRGAPAVDGDGGAPLNAGLRGMTGLARGAPDTFYVVQGAAADGSGAVRLRTVNWGWSAPNKLTAKATTPGQAYSGETLAGLQPQGARLTLAEVLSAGECAAPATPGACLSPYLISATDGAPWMADLAAASPYSAPGGAGSYAVAGSAPTAGASAVGAPFAVATLGTPGGLVALPPYSGCCAAGDPPTVGVPVPLPAGAAPTGVAVLAPATDAQTLALGGHAYILVATASQTTGPALLIYRAAAETCGLTAAPAGCTRFPGAPTLAATVSLAPDATAGAVAAALSDDGTHAFALVTNPASNHVSVIDLAAFLSAGTAPTVTARIDVASPGAIVIRHDALAAYISAGDGQIAVLTTAGWLASGVPAALNNDAVILATLGADTTITTALALSSDDAQLFAILRGADGGATLAAASVGDFGQPGPVKVTGQLAADAQTVALALTPDDNRLLTLAAPNGPNHPGVLRTYATHDPSHPLAWLPEPLSLGATPTPPNPLLVLTAQP